MSDFFSNLAGQALGRAAVLRPIHSLYRGGAAPEMVSAAQPLASGSPPGWPTPEVDEIVEDVEARLPASGPSREQSRRPATEDFDRQTAAYREQSESPNNGPVRTAPFATVTLQPDAGRHPAGIPGSPSSETESTRPGHVERPLRVANFEAPTDLQLSDDDRTNVAQPPRAYRESTASTESFTAEFVTNQAGSATPFANTFMSSEPRPPDRSNERSTNRDTSDSSVGRIQTVTARFDETLDYKSIASEVTRLQSANRVDETRTEKRSSAFPLAADSNALFDRPTSLGSTPQEPRQISVTIGRLEVRVATTTNEKTRTAREVPSRPDFDDYLKARERGGRR